MSSYTVEFASGGTQGIVGKTALSIPENTLDTTDTPVTLTGKGVSNYGQIQQTNFVQMLENFASSSAPVHATVGQLWFNSGTGILYLCIDPANSAITETTYYPASITAAPAGGIAWVQIWPSTPGAGSVIESGNNTLSGNNIYTGSNTFEGSSSLPALVVTNAEEVVFPVAAGPTATQNVYIANGALQYFTVDAVNDWAVNFAWSSTSAFNAVAGVNRAVTVAMIVTQGATPYFPSTFEIDGVPVTPMWQGGVAPIAGDASSVDVYTFTIIKTASATYTVLGAVTKYA